MHAARARIPQRILRHALARCCLLPIIVMCLAMSAHAAPFAYIPKGGALKVAVLDLANNTVVTNISVPLTPIGIATSPDGMRAYVICQNAKLVSVIDTTSNTVIGSITVGNGPWSAVVSPDNTRLYVTNTNDNTISAIDTTSNSVIATLSVGTGLGASPTGITITPDGSHLYVAASNGISVIDTASNTVTTTIALIGGLPNGIAMSPDGTRTYAALAGGNGVAVINNATNTLVQTVALGSGTNPNGIVVSPDNTKVYASALNGKTVSVIDVASLAVTATVPVGTRLYGIDVAADGKHVYTVNFDSPPTVNVIDTSTNTLSASIALGDSGRTWAIGRFIAPTSMLSVPDAPQLTCATAGNAQATLTFTAPTSNGGTAITGYVGHCGAITATGTAPPIVVGGLTNGVSYSCYVTATNAIGNSAPSASLNVTPVTTPDPPTITGISAGNASVTVGFSPPANNGGSTITGYVATCGSQSVSGIASPLVVAGLDNGVAVTCTIIASNAIGNSVPSAPSGSVTPATVPDAPMITAAASGDGQTVISFDAPAQNGGGAILGYSANCTPGMHSASGANSPLTVTGLSNGVTYSCTTTATNLVGASAASGSLQVTPLAPADLSISVSHGSDFVAGGMPTVYTIVVSNIGPSAVSGAHVADTLDADFSLATWTCDSTNGGVCPSGSGSGEIDTLVDLPIGASVTLLWTATIAALPESPVSNMATITVPNTFNDTDPGNNIATDGPDVRGIFRDGFD